jgi:hypothetical protein
MQGVLYSHRSNFLHAFVIAMPDTLDLRGGSTILMVVPMFHANRCAHTQICTASAATHTACLHASSSAAEASGALRWLHHPSCGAKLLSSI